MRVHALRDLLAGTGWVERTQTFAGALRRTSINHDGLLLVGTPDDEPWHLAAHLDDESRLAAVPGLSPTLLRWTVPPGAPPHLSMTLARLEEVARNETVFVVAPTTAPEGLLERVADARRIGATILSMDDDDELAGLAHERLLVPRGTSTGQLVTPDMDTMQHLVSVAAGERVTRTSVRNRLARFLEHLSGASPER